MVSEIRQLKLADVATIVGGGTPSTKVSQYWDGAIPWITPKDLSGHKHVYISKGKRSISEEGFRASSVKLIPANSVLYTSRAPIGYIAINNVDVTTNQGFKSLIPKKEFDTTYLYYLLKFSKHKVLELASGGTFAEISASSMAQVVLPFPYTKVQKAIGKFALGLDQKIQLNIEISETLEQIAQTIFKSWFVDFDPVNAKARGEQPAGMDSETAALFPDSFEDSELGPIPSGWSLRKAEQLFEISIGRTPPRKEPEWFSDGGSGIPWVSIRDMGTFGVFSDTTNESLTEEAVDKFRVPIVPANTVLMSFKLTVGKLCITQSPLVTNEAIAHFKQSSDSQLSSYYTYMWLKEFDLEKLDSTSSIATATNSTAIRNIKFLVPPKEISSQFNIFIKPIFEKIRNVTQQNSTLIKLRDSLLPKLISGELQIPDEMLAS